MQDRTGLTVFLVRVVFVLFETRRFCKVARFVFPDLYTFPKAWTKKIGLENVRVYVSGQNLFSFNSFYKGWDPENEIGTGDSPSYYPVNSIYSFGFNFKF